MQFGVRNRPEMMPGELGFAWVPLAMSAAQAAMDKDGKGSGTPMEQKPGMPGTEPSSPRQPSAVTTVSPTIQAQISPQISPVMTQIQDSAGATVGANPTQYMPGGMKGEGGGSAVSPAGNYAAPGIPSGMPGQPYGSGFMPQSPYTLDPMTMRYNAMPAFPTAQYGQPAPGVGGTLAALPWTALAIVAATAVGAMAFLGKKKRAA